MEKLIEESNLNVNFWLLKVGLMYGHLNNGVIQSTKFTIFKWFTAFCLSIFTAIKWTTYLFCAKESRMCNLLGDWSYFYGPKLLVDLILFILAIFVLLVFLLFYFSSKNPKKMLFWLEHMQFDNENRCFNKLELNQSDSKEFVKRMSLLFFTFNISVYPLTIFFAISNIITVFISRKSHHFYYIISILIFTPQFYINSCCIFGLLVILYQVSQYLNYYI